MSLKNVKVGDLIAVSGREGLSSIRRVDAVNKRFVTDMAGGKWSLSGREWGNSGDPWCRNRAWVADPKDHQQLEHQRMVREWTKRAMIASGKVIEIPLNSPALAKIEAALAEAGQ